MGQGFEHVMAFTPDDDRRQWHCLAGLLSRHPGHYWSAEGAAYFRMGRYPEAVDALKQSEQGNPYLHMWLICAYSELGREADGRAEAAQVLRVSPGFSVEEMRQRLPRAWLWQEPKWVQRCLAELREAGLK